MTEDQRQRLGALVRVWNEIAARHGHEVFEVRFFPQLKRLNRFQMDFPAKDAQIPLRALEVTVLNVIHQEFHPDEILKFLQDLRKIELHPDQGTH